MCTVVVSYSFNLELRTYINITVPTKAQYYGLLKTKLLLRIPIYTIGKLEKW